MPKLDTAAFLLFALIIIFVSHIFLLTFVKKFIWSWKILLSLLGTSLILALLIGSFVASWAITFAGLLLLYTIFLAVRR